MKRTVCITGIGVVNPSGIGKEQFWENVATGKNSIRIISRFNCKNLPIKIAGEIDSFNVHEFVPRRLVVKMDRFAHYALAASELALIDANLDLKTLDPYRVGVWFGNNAGGWDICEKGLFELYREGATLVNPWQATAWFPTSAQGYVSIAKGIKGMSKSFICDRASSASALFFALRSIEQGHNDIILAGGTEAPLTAFGMTCYFETGELAASESNPNIYKPFDRKREGVVLGEGSTVLILEEKKHALQRGARIYGEIVSGVMATDPDPKNYDRFKYTQQKALTDAQLSVNDIDFILAEGAGTHLSDQVEAKSIIDVFKNNKDVPVTCPKSGFGHLYGASTATDVAISLLASKYKLIPPTLNYEEGDKGIELNIIDKPVSKNINYTLVNSRAREGTNVSLVISSNNY